MPTRIEVQYDRIVTDSVVQDIAARGTVSVSVLGQLGTPYQTLPGYEMVQYQNEVNSLVADITSLQSHIDAIRPLLQSIDNKARPLDDKNKGILRTLQGLLKTDADRALLGQITGPIARRPSTPPTTPTP